MTGVDDGTGNPVSYSYDGLDRVASRNGTQDFTYAGANIDPVSDSESTVSRSPGGRIVGIEDDSLDALLAGLDRHGDLTVLFNDDLTINQNVEFDSFGEIEGGGTDTAFGFQGDWTDPDSGDVWMGARWYTPHTATFRSRDTVRGELRSPVTLNRYTYANNNPQSYWDPDGRYAAGMDSSAAASMAQANFIKTFSQLGNAPMRASSAPTTPTYRPTVHLTSGVNRVGSSMGGNGSYRSLTQLTNGYNDTPQPAPPIILETTRPTYDRPMVAVTASVTHFVSEQVSAIAYTTSPPSANSAQDLSAQEQAALIVVAAAQDALANVFGNVVESGGGCNWRSVWNCGDELVSVASVAVQFIPGYDCFSVARDLISGNVDAGTAVDAAFCAADLIPAAGSVVDVVRAGDNLKDAANGADAAHDLSNIAGATCSFAGDTSVLMADGSTEPISEIEIGDWVFASDPETGESGAREVTHLWVHQDTLVNLDIEGDSVTTTEDHPFWNASDGQWQRADELDSGDTVLTADGDLLEVDGIDWTAAQTGTAYNLTVEGIHTYYIEIGSENVLVHNTCPVVRTGPGSVPPADRDPTRAFTPQEKAQGLADQGGLCAHCDQALDIQDSGTGG